MQHHDYFIYVDNAQQCDYYDYDFDYDYSNITTNYAHDTNHNNKHGWILSRLWRMWCWRSIIEQ